MKIWTTNKTLMLMMSLMLVVLMMSSVAASKTYDSETDTYSTYDYIFFKKYDISLDRVEDSIINAEAQGHLVVHKDSKVFKKVFYKDRNGNSHDFDLTKGQEFNVYLNTSTQWFRKVNLTYETVGCEDSGNGTLINCYENETGFDWEEYYEYDWAEVNYDAKIPEGSYEWLIKAKKPLNKKVDFIIQTDDEGDLVEWAWWNNSWAFKRELSNLTGEYPIINISYEAAMNVDGSDLRFLDSTETIELNYTIRDSLNSSWFYVGLDTNNATEIYMYYSNAGASTTDSANDTYQSPQGYYYLDNPTGTSSESATDSFDVTEVGSSSFPGATGKFGLAWDFSADGDSLESSVTSGISGASPRSSMAWFKKTAQLSCMIGLGTGSTNDEYALCSGGAGNVYLSATFFATDVVASTMPMNLNEWIHGAITYDGTTVRGYINNTEVINSAIALTTIAGNVNLGSRQGWPTGLDGLLDETSWFDYQLSAHQVAEFYSMEVQTDTYVLGAEISSNEAPNVTLTSPANNTIINSNGYNALFEYIPTDSEQPLDNCTLEVWNQSTSALVHTQTDTGIVNGTSQNFTQILVPTNYSWNVFCVDNESASNYSAHNRTINILSIPDNAPNIEADPSNPSGNFILSGMTYNFNFWNVYDDFGIDNVSLVMNSVINQTNSSVINNSNLTFSLVLGDGFYEYYGVAIDNASQQTQTVTTNFTIDTTPFIGFIYPTPVNASIETEAVLPVGLNITPEIYFENVTIYLYNVSGLQESVTFTNSSRVYNFTILSDGNYTLNATTWTNTSQSNSTETRDYSFDVNPPTVLVTNPDGTFVYLDDTYTLDLNYSISDTNIDTCSYTYAQIPELKYDDGTQFSSNTSGLIVSGWIYVVDYTSQSFKYQINDGSGGIVSLRVARSSDNASVLADYQDLPQGAVQTTAMNLSENGYHYFEINHAPFASSIGIADLFQVVTPTAYATNHTNLNCSTNTTFDYQVGTNTLTAFANDTFGSLASDTKTWNVSFADHDNYTYTSPITEGVIQTITGNLFIEGVTSILNTSLVYGNNTYVANIAQLSGSEYSIEATHLVIESGNISFNFVINLNNGSAINLLTNYQTVLDLGLGNCSFFNYTVFTMNLYDELDLSDLNGTIQYDVGLYPDGTDFLIQSFTGNETGTNFVEICSESELNASNYDVSLETRYFADNYSAEFYHIQKMDSMDLPTQVNLYDLADVQTTEFNIIYRGTDYTLVDDALLQIQRRYVDEGLYRVVEIPLTSQKGETIGHFDLDNYKYQIVATKDGITLDVFTNPLVSCQNEFLGDCTISLRSTSGVSSETEITNTRDFSYSADQDNGTVSVFFAIPSGNSETVNVYMEQQDRFGSRPVCNTTVYSSSSTISCSVNKTLGDSVVKVTIRKAGVIEADLTAIYNEDLSAFFLLNNYFLAVIILMSGILMMISSPVAMVIVALFTVFYLGMIFLIKGVSLGVAAAGVVWLVIAGIILIVKMVTQEEKN